MQFLLLQHISRSLFQLRQGSHGNTSLTPNYCAQTQRLRCMQVVYDSLTSHLFLAGPSSQQNEVCHRIASADRQSESYFFPSPFSLKVVRYVSVHCSSPSVAFGSFQNLRVFLTYFNFILLLFIPQDRRERGLATMKELLRQKTYQGALSKLSSPLDPSFKLRNLKLVFLL